MKIKFHEITISENELVSMSMEGDIEIVTELSPCSLPALVVCRYYLLIVERQNSPSWYLDAQLKSVTVLKKGSKPKIELFFERHLS